MSQNPVRITRAVIDRVAEHATRSYAADEEACGYLTGPQADPFSCDESVELVNLANRYHRVDPETYPRTGRTYFLLDPLKFSKAVEAGKTSGRPVRVLYHSHLDVGAYFSETDAQAATMGGDRPSYDGLFYLVTSIRQGTVDDHKLFAWDERTKGFVETPMEIVT
ncbi:MAG TPA: Mov34/MPN/PAD-1 family protein [Polyangiaceae bacterium]|nr:Mov34/MPN/PAD-1 family protein [Polyangiaceae bacterium]